MTSALDRCVRIADEESALDLLLKRTGEGDRIAFAELYDRVSPSVYGLLVGRLGNGPVSADVLADVFVDVWHRSLHSDVPVSTVRAWMYGIASRHAAHASP